MWGGTDVTCTIKENPAAEAKCRFCGEAITPVEDSQSRNRHSLMRCIGAFLARFEALEQRVAELESKQP